MVRDPVGACIARPFVAVNAMHGQCVPASGGRATNGRPYEGGRLDLFHIVILNEVKDPARRAECRFAGSFVIAFHRMTGGGTGIVVISRPRVSR